jgi:HK97 family phage prohead protease
MKKKEFVYECRACFEPESVEIRKDEKGKSTIAGYAVVFEKLSQKIGGFFREKVRAGAFTDSLKKNNIRALWNHNSDHVLGSTKAGTLRLTEDEKGLRFEVDAPETQAGRDALTTIERGDVDGMSFGFNVRKQEWDETNPEDIIRTLVDVDLREISPTPFPAYTQTKVAVRSVEDDFADHAAEVKAENERKEQEKQVAAQKVAADFDIAKKRFNLLTFI